VACRHLERPSQYGEALVVARNVKSKWVRSSGRE